MPKKFVLFIFLLLPAFAYTDSDSIFVVQQNNGRRELKKSPSSYSSQVNSAVEAQKVERLQYRGYIVLLNRLSSGQYEVQVSRTVRYGSKNINSIFASQFEASIEYTYVYDASQNRIRREHYLFPPNPLTGWTNPGDYMTIQEFAWKGSFPSKNCTADVHTSEEYNREYLEASCFAGRDAALDFARRFINYVLGSRGL